MIELDVKELEQKALNIKNAEMNLDLARRKRTERELELWTTTNWVEVGVKLAKEKEIYVQAELDELRKNMHLAEANLGLLVRLYEIAYIQYQKE